MSPFPLIIPSEIEKELMNRDKFGVSRLRVADGDQLPEGSSAVALTPIRTSLVSGRGIPDR